MPTTATPEASTSSLAGKTLRWKFEDGPTGGTYEHTFNADGSVEFRKLDGDKEGKPTRGTKYGSFDVAPQVHAVSYLSAESGYTLTVVMNFETRKIYGFASNEKEWHPVSGTMEIVK